MVIDIGTGDGRAVLARANAESRSLVIGVDASAAAMSDASRRADRRGVPNAVFLAAGAEVLPGSPLTGVADVVTVTFPWGSLLRGVLGGDGTALAGVAATLSSGGRLEVLASVQPSDGVPGLSVLDASAIDRVRAAWCDAGLELDTFRPATDEDLAASGSTWARRLGVRRARDTGPATARRAWRLAGRLR